jgi:hypothetical protein
VRHELLDVLEKIICRARVAAQHTVHPFNARLCVLRLNQNLAEVSIFKLNPHDEDLVASRFISTRCVRRNEDGWTPASDPPIPQWVASDHPAGNAHRDRQGRRIVIAWIGGHAN